MGDELEHGQTLETLVLIASDQWGIISTAQAEREGITRLQLGRMADRGVIQRARRGIYHLPSVEFGPLTDLRTAWVTLNPNKSPDERWEEGNDLAVSHESAAAVHGIGDLIPKALTFSTKGRKQTSHKDIRIFCNRSFKNGDVANIDGLPVTSVERTVADLAEQKIEPGYLATTAVEALRKEGVRFAVLARHLDPFSAFYGAASGAELLLNFQEEAGSVEDDHEILARSLRLFSDNFMAQMVDPSIVAQFGSVISQATSPMLEIMPAKSPIFEQGISPLRSLTAESVAELYPSQAFSAQLNEELKILISQVFDNSSVIKRFQNLQFRGPSIAEHCLQNVSFPSIDSEVFTSAPIEPTRKPGSE